MRALLTLALLCPGAAYAQNDLERARTLYNTGQFDESIAAATIAKSKRSTAASATLIIARSRLEKFRTLGDERELATAREELISLNPRTLGPQEAIEWQIGVGTSLFFENQPGAAAESFAAVIPSARERLTQIEFEKLVVWGGASTSRLAESLTGEARKRVYETLRSSARTELERNPLSRPAIYWTVVSSRGAGDLEGAWGAAVAGWIRAGPPDGAPLRADLERFVTQTLIPERAQARTGQRLDAKPTVVEIGALTEEWRALTARWAGES